jgi:hypothetical protein
MTESPLNHKGSWDMDTDIPQEAHASTLEFNLRQVQREEFGRMGVHTHRGQQSNGSSSPRSRQTLSFQRLLCLLCTGIKSRGKRGDILSSLG